ncbi:MAG: hypothetical protein WC817_02325 [Patescibacteria group bacterium]|jgi:hypothetical protein
MSFFRKAGAPGTIGADSDPRHEELVEEMRVVAQAHEIYEGLVGTGEVGNIMEIPEGGSELDGAIQAAWERVQVELNAKGIKSTDKIGGKFRGELNDAWGLKHVGVDY